MKLGIHPAWYPDAVVTCACGNTWTTGSTKKEIHTDVCNKCHPFFTGEQRIVDTAGQVERFMKRMSAKEQIAATQPAAEDKKAKKEKRREHKAGTTISLHTPPAAPEELPLAVVVEQAAVEPTPVVEPPVSHIEPLTFEPVAVEEPAVSAVKVEEPTVSAVKVEEPAVSAVKVEEPAVSAVKVEEPAVSATKVEEIVLPPPTATLVSQVAASAPVAVAAATTPAAPVVETSAIAADDLTIVEGIGPKISSVLKNAGITTLRQLAQTSVEKLSETLKAANLNLADPGTWPAQAQLAAEGKTAELEKLQDALAGGRRVARGAKKPAAKKTAAPKAKSSAGK